MIKLQWQNDQEALFEACGGVMSELIDTDTGVKSAASAAIGKDILEQFRPDKDHWLQHVVALGDYEMWGENRNADAYDKKANVERHHTFVKYGHFFREHRHTSPTLKIGDIKYACYNPEMGRVELLMWGNKKKAAAEYADAQANKTRTYSMACRIDHDVCAVCQHEAPRPSDWCSHMKLSRGQYLPEHKKYAFVFNPNPTYFDISDVGYQADRTAYGLRQIVGGSEGEGMLKAASTGLAINGAEWAELEGIAVPASVANEAPVKFSTKTAAVIARFVALEEQATKDYADCTQEVAQTAKAASAATRISALPQQHMDALRKVAPGCAFRKLAECRVILPLPEFAAMLYGNSPKDMEKDCTVQEASKHVEGGFKQLLGAGTDDMEPLFSMASHRASEMDAEYNDGFDKAVDTAEDLFGLDGAPDRCALSIMKAAFATPTERLQTETTIDIPADKLASAYMQYAATALADMGSLGKEASDTEVALLFGRFSQNGGLFG